MTSLPLRQRGFGAIMAVMILVMLAALAAAIMRFSTGQQLGSAQDILAARAWAAAQGGTEWGLSQALQANSCVVGPTTFAVGQGMKVSVACDSTNDTTDYREGESAPGVARRLRVFRVVATACNGTGAACPDNASVGNPVYVERQRVVTAACYWSGTACLP